MLLYEGGQQLDRFVPEASDRASFSAYQQLQKLRWYM
jgi:hypothetical protein